MSSITLPRAALVEFSLLLQLKSPKQRTVGVFIRELVDIIDWNEGEEKVANLICSKSHEILNLEPSLIPKAVDNLIAQIKEHNIRIKFNDIPEDNFLSVEKRVLFINALDDLLTTTGNLYFPGKASFLTLIGLSKLGDVEKLVQIDKQMQMLAALALQKQKVPMETETQDSEIERTHNFL